MLDEMETGDHTLVELNAVLDQQLTTAQECLARWVALESWSIVLDQNHNQNPSIAVATDIITTLATQSTGMLSNDIVPSLESNDASGKLRQYAKRLLDALIRLMNRIGETVKRFFETLLSRTRTLRMKIAKIRRVEKNKSQARATNQHFKPSLGLATKLVIRNQPVRTKGTLFTALEDISALANALQGTHLTTLDQLGTRLTKIITSDNVDNIAEIESEITSAFSSISQTGLSKLCTRQISTDPRFTSTNYVTYASVNLIGNKTLFLTKPVANSKLDDTFGNVTLEMMWSTPTSDEWVPKEIADFETGDKSFLSKLLGQCDQQIETLEQIGKQIELSKLAKHLKGIHDAAKQRAQKGGLNMATAELLQAASVAYSAASTTPVRGVLTQLTQTVDTCLDIVSETYQQYD